MLSEMIRDYALALTAVIGFPLVYWRTLIQHRQYKVSENQQGNIKKQITLLESQIIDKKMEGTFDRFQKCTEWLGSENSYKRVSAVRFLDEIARIDGYSIVVADVLSHFIASWPAGVQENSPKHPSEDFSLAISVFEAICSENDLGHIVTFDEKYINFQTLPWNSNRYRFIECRIRYFGSVNPDMSGVPQNQIIHDSIKFVDCGFESSKINAANYRGQIVLKSALHVEIYRFHSNHIYVDPTKLQTKTIRLVGCDISLASAGLEKFSNLVARSMGPYEVLTNHLDRVVLDSPHLAHHCWYWSDEPPVLDEDLILSRAVWVIDEKYRTQFEDDYKENIYFMPDIWEIRRLAGDDSS